MYKVHQWFNGVKLSTEPEVPEDEDHFIQKSTWPATRKRKTWKDQETGKLVPGASRTLLERVRLIWPQLWEMLVSYYED